MVKETIDNQGIHFVSQWPRLTVLAVVSDFPSEIRFTRFVDPL